MEAEGEEVAGWVVPVVLMPCHILRLQEVRPPQQRMFPPELDQAAAPGKAEPSEFRESNKIDPPNSSPKRCHSENGACHAGIQQ